MKFKKLTFVLLGIISASAFAGDYTNKDYEPEDNQDNEYHFYVDLGTAAYYFNQPDMVLPLSTGYGDYGSPANSAKYPTTPGDSYNSDKWAFNPSITLGYRFLTDNADIQKIFGQQNAIELRAAYFHSTGTQDESYAANYYVNNFPITGNSNFGNDSSFDMSNSSVSFDNTYEDIGLYYTGNKVINNSLINSPYVGIDFSYLKQDSNYSETQYILVSDEPYYNLPLDGVGSDDLNSYYMGLAFGDKMTWLLANHYGAYGKLGASVYWMHTKLDASQTLVTNQPQLLDQSLIATYTVSTTDDQITFKAQAEIGFNYYFNNNQDPMSTYVTLLAGIDYWNDVPYADNPTQDNQAVKIAYESAFNPYAGLQLHIPL